MLKITAGKSKKRKIWSYDSLQIFFWVSYDVCHQKKTWRNTILLRDGADNLDQTA